MTPERIKKFLQQLNGLTAGIFIDDSNLYHSYQKYGWRFDVQKLKHL